MSTDKFRELAEDLFEQAYQHQLEGDLDIAVNLYLRSIEAYPTAEAHTFLGWAYSSQGKLDEAIAECKKAIEVDPDFGNPYNDIGSYLIQKLEYEEAIPWLLQALLSKRYELRHFAHYNLGQAYEGVELYSMARQAYEQALLAQPDYQPAGRALAALRTKVQ